MRLGAHEIRIDRAGSRLGERLLPAVSRLASVSSLKEDLCGEPRGKREDCKGGH